MPADDDNDDDDDDMFWFIKVVEEKQDENGMGKDERDISLPRLEPYDDAHGEAVVNEQMDPCREGWREGNGEERVGG